jgi:hypothetical protein
MSSKKKASNSIGYRIIKKEDSYGDSSDTDSSHTDSVSSGYSSQGGGKYRFTSIVESSYKKSKTGSKQDNMTKEQIKEKLQGYKALKTSQDKRYILNLKPFKVWIRYFNTVTKEFRVGGLLKLVDPSLRYIMLVNTNKNLTWSVQLKDNIIFVPNNVEEKQQEREKEKLTKEKLYKLYKDGKLAKK